jgi:hypothetical protein
VPVRAGHTEGAVDLMRLSGHEPVAVISEIVAPDGSMARGAQLRAFAAEHGLPVLAIADLVRYRRATERLVEHVATSTMPNTAQGLPGDPARAPGVADPQGIRAGGLPGRPGQSRRTGRERRGCRVRIGAFPHPGVEWGTAAAHITPEAQQPRGAL